MKMLLLQDPLGRYSGHGLVKSRTLRIELSSLLSRRSWVKTCVSEGFFFLATSEVHGVLHSAHQPRVHSGDKNDTI